jgi:hypothetical protein
MTLHPVSGILISTRPDPINDPVAVSCKESTFCLILAKQVLELVTALLGV